MPIQRPLSRTWAMEPGVVLLEGRIDIGAGGAVQTTSRSPGVTVTRTAAGAYTFTLDDGVAPRGIVGLVDLMIAAANPSLFARWTSRTSSVLTLLVETGLGVDTDPPSGSEIHYLLIVGNSSVSVP